MEFLAFLMNFSFLKGYKLGQPIRNVRKDHVTRHMRAKMFLR